MKWTGALRDSKLVTDDGTVLAEVRFGKGKSVEIAGWYWRVRRQNAGQRTDEGNGWFTIERDFSSWHYHGRRSTGVQEAAQMAVGETALGKLG